jgi:hypothetical protein
VTRTWLDDGSVRYYNRCTDRSWIVGSNDSDDSDDSDN